RHTRFSRDWSSDVCSSDLKAQEAVQKAIDLAQGNNQQMIEPAHLLKGVMLVGENVTSFLFQKLGVNVRQLETVLDREIESYPRRSEERRVGKGWWWRWAS